MFYLSSYWILEVDEYLTKARKFDEKAKKREFMIVLDGTMRCKGRIYVLETANLREQLLRKAHETLYSVHLGTIKM